MYDASNVGEVLFVSESLKGWKDELKLQAHVLVNTICTTLWSCWFSDVDVVSLGSGERGRRNCYWNTCNDKEFAIYIASFEIELGYVSLIKSWNNRVLLTHLNHKIHFEFSSRKKKVIGEMACKMHGQTRIGKCSRIFQIDNLQNCIV